MSETLSFLTGETTGYPLRPSFRTDAALVGSARLLRTYHDACSGFEHDELDRWFLPTREPVEVICHGDFAPYNCVITDGAVSGVFDFDTAHPGPRLWDLGYGAYRWVTLTAPDNEDGLDGHGEQRRRLLLFCDAYGTENLDGVLRAATDRLEALVEMMRDLAKAGNAAFGGHVRKGHDLRYLADIAYIREHTLFFGRQR